jgi:hypothetical protein
MNRARITHSADVRRAEVTLDRVSAFSFLQHRLGVLACHSSSNAEMHGTGSTDASGNSS